MPKKENPIKLVLIILALAMLVFGTAMAVVLSLTNLTPAISIGHKIGVIPIQGKIKDSHAITQQLLAFRKNKQIKAIILKIDSPGGGVVPSQEIYAETRRTTKRKKVVAYLGSLAASGGYYVAAAADKIMANPGTLTGSIGVLAEFVRVEELLNKIGVEMEVIKSGEFKDMGSPARKMTEREKQLIRDMLEDVRGQFIDAVALGRNLSREKVIEIADGRIFSGEQAKKLDLVDELGNFYDAVDLAKRMANIKGEAELVYPERRRRSLLWDLVFKDMVNAVLERFAESPLMLQYKWDGKLMQTVK